MRKRLVTIFKANQRDTFATSELVERTHSETYPALLNKLDNGSKDERREASREKSRLHRKILYHLRRLEEANTISTVRRTSSGEKIFTYTGEDKNPRTPCITAGVERHARRKTVQSAVANDHLVRSHDAQADPTTDAVLINAATISPDNLADAINKISKITNDVIAITGLTAIIDNPSYHKSFLDTITSTANSTGCYICLRLTAENVTAEHYKYFVTEAYKRTNTNVKLVCTTTKHSLQAVMIQEAQNTKRKAHFEHASSQTPVFVGRLGPYSISKAAWDHVSSADHAQITCLAHTTYTIDINQYLDENSITDLRTLIADAAKEAYLDTADARNDVTNALKTYYDQPPTFYIDFFNTTQNIIRFWNYPLNENYESFKTLISSTKSHITSLTQKQATIFQACGIPLDLDTALAPAFSTGIPNTFTDRQYEKQTLHGIDELNQPYWQQFLNKREETARLFNNADRTRVFRAPINQPETAIREINHLDTNRSLGITCYDFQRLHEERQLHEFL